MEDYGNYSYGNSQNKDDKPSELNAEDRLDFKNKLEEELLKLDDEDVSNDTMVNSTVRSTETNSQKEINDTNAIVNSFLYPNNPLDRNPIFKVAEQDRKAKDLRRSDQTGHQSKKAGDEL